MSTPISIAIAGAGRMGQAIARKASDDKRFTLVGMAGRESDLAGLVQQADVVIDFSLPGGTDRLLEIIVAHAKPLVCGVTGLSATQMEQLAAAAQVVPVVYDRNMSQGITLLNKALQSVAGALGADFDVRIEETHHIHKKDAPSGTALKLGATVAAARAMQAGEVRYASERRGEIPGDHSVIFSSVNEVVTLSHSVRTRDVFADGALRAAEWVRKRAVGQYSMQDVLFDV